MAQCRVQVSLERRGKRTGQTSLYKLVGEYEDLPPMRRVEFTKAFERGSNENGNRMIRRRVPKGTDFTGIAEDDTLRVQRWVNEYPRSILGGRCAARVLMELAQKAGIEGIELLL